MLRRRENDGTRRRPPITTDHLERWQTAEIAGLRKLCEANDILFVCLTESGALATRVTTFIRELPYPQPVIQHLGSQVQDGHNPQAPAPS
jgi:hypothetical protein